MSAPIAGAVAAYVLVGFVVAGALNAYGEELVVVIPFWPLIATYVLGEWLRRKVSP